MRVLLCLRAVGLCSGATVQDEGNALSDMAAAMPGLKSISGKHIVMM